MVSRLYYPAHKSRKNRTSNVAAIAIIRRVGKATISGNRQISVVAVQNAASRVPGAGCHRSRYPETCAFGLPEQAQVCEYADLWHP